MPSYRGERGEDCKEGVGEKEKRTNIIDLHAHRAINAQHSYLILDDLIAGFRIRSTWLRVSGLYKTAS